MPEGRGPVLGVVKKEEFGSGGRGNGAIGADLPVAY